MTDSVAFEWADGDFDGLMRANEVDEAVQITLRYIPGKQSKVLEAGAGTGRVVRYLVELGFEDVHGIELNEDAARARALNRLLRTIPFFHNHMHIAVLQKPATS